MCRGTRVHGLKKGTYMDLHRNDRYFICVEVETSSNSLTISSIETTKVIVVFTY